MAVLSNIMQIYQSYPWVFDGIIICTLLGVLFRILFEKGKIGEEKQARKLGGIFGFFLGIAMIGYMQYRGWLLFIDGGPWIFGIIIMSLCAVFWAIIDGYLNHEKRSMTIPIAFVVATGLIYAFLNFVPSYMAGVSDLFGGSIWIWHLIMWCLMIFILFWALTGLMAGAYPEGGGIPGVGRRIASGWQHVKDAYDWAKKEGVGSAAKWTAKAPFKAGWWGMKGLAHGAGAIARRTPLVKRLFKGKGVSTPEDLDNAGKETDTQLGDTTGKANELDQALQASKAIHQKIVEILNKIRELSKTTKKDITTLKPDECTGIAAALKEQINELGKIPLPGKEILDKIAKTKDSIENAKSSVEYYTATAGIYEKLPILLSLIEQIEDAGKRAAFEVEAKKEQEHMNFIAGKLQEIAKEFEDNVNIILQDKDLTEVTTKISDLLGTTVEIITQAGIQIEDLNKIPGVKEENQEAARVKISETCTKLIDLTTVAIEKLGTFDRATIDAKLRPEIRMIDKIRVTYQKKRDEIHKEYNTIMKDVEALIAQVQEILSHQATPEEKAALIASLSEVLEIIKRERDTLRALLTDAKTFIKVLNLSFLRVRGQKDIAAKTIVTEEGEEVLEMTAATPAAAIPTGEEEAENITTAAIEEAKKLRKTAATNLQTAKVTITKTISQLRYAEGHLTTILNKGTGISPENRKKLGQLLRNLSAFLSEEEDLKSLIQMLGSYEDYVFNIIMARVIKHAAGKRKPKMTVSAAINEMIKIINRLKKKLELLDTEIGYIEKEVKEMAVPAPSGSSTGAVGPIEMPVPPPPA